MNDLEKWLAEQSLPEPSPQLDQRMETLFRNHTRKKGLRKPVPLWLSLAACLLCFTGGLALRTVPAPAVAPAPPPVVNAVLTTSEKAPVSLFDWSGDAPANKSPSRLVLIETKIQPQRPRDAA